VTRQVYALADVDGPSFTDYGGYLFFNGTTDQPPASLFVLPPTCQNVTVQAGGVSHRGCLDRWRRGVGG
jgi:hypothetical protein